MRLKPFVTRCLAVTLLGSLALPAWSDILHFHNGKVLRTDIHRVTGDIIEVKNGWAQTSDVTRLQLTNRRDVVELWWGNGKIFGEIVYLDKFQIEIKTATGTQTVDRWKVKNIVMGTPHINPQQDEFFIESASQQTDEHPVPAERHIHPAVESAAPRLDLDFVP